MKLADMQREAGKKKGEHLAAEEPHIFYWELVKTKTEREDIILQFNLLGEWKHGTGMLTLHCR